MLKRIVVESKLIDYQYFMDQLQLYELYLLMDLIPWANKQQLEQTRILLWGTISPYLKKHKSAEEIMPLYTDKDYDYDIKEEKLPDNEIDKIREIINKQWQIN